MESPLNRLIVKDTALNDELLAASLDPLVQLTATGEVIFRERLRSATNRKKVLTILLARDAAARLKLGAGGEATPKEIEELTGIRGNSLRPVLKALVDARLLASTQGRYRIPAFSLHAVVEEIRDV